jgi:hypothetical protein
VRTSEFVSLSREARAPQNHFFAAGLLTRQSREVIGLGLVAADFNLSRRVTVHDGHQACNFAL